MAKKAKPAKLVETVEGYAVMHGPDDSKFLAGSHEFPFKFLAGNRKDALRFYNERVQYGFASKVVRVRVTIEEV